MGLGGYLAGRTEIDHYNAELNREYFISNLLRGEPMIRFGCPEKRTCPGKVPSMQPDWSKKAGGACFAWNKSLAGTLVLVAALRGGGDSRNETFCSSGAGGSSSSRVGDGGAGNAHCSGERPCQRCRDPGQGRTRSRAWSHGPSWRTRPSLRLGPWTRPSLRLVPAPSSSPLVISPAQKPPPGGFLMSRRLATNREGCQRFSKARSKSVRHGCDMAALIRIRHRAPGVSAIRSRPLCGR